MADAELEDIEKKIREAENGIESARTEAQGEITNQGEDRMVETPNQFLPLDLSTADLLLRRLDIVEAELEDISRKIREAEDHVEFAMSLGTEAYTGALAYLSALQAERIILLQKQGPLDRRVINQTIPKATDQLAAEHPGAIFERKLRESSSQASKEAMMKIIAEKAEEDKRRENRQRHSRYAIGSDETERLLP